MDCIPITASLLALAAAMSGCGGEHLAVEATQQSLTASFGVETVLATDATIPDEIAGITTNATHVYWANYSANAVNRVAISGGAIRLIASTPHPLAVAVSSSSIYWVNGGTQAADHEDGAVRRTVLSGGTITTLASGLAAPYGIALDASRVYWGTGGSSPNNGSVDSVSLLGGAVISHAVHQNAPFTVAVDARNVYWGNIGWQGMVSTDREEIVGVAPIRGTTSRELARRRGRYGSIAVDAQFLYAANIGTPEMHYTDGEIEKISLSSGAVTTLVSGQTNLMGIALDATGLYWITRGSRGPAPMDGTLNRIAVMGGAVTQLASGQRAPAALSVSAHGLYWVNSGDGTVRRLPR